MFRIIQKRKIWLMVSAILCSLSILSLIFFGLKFGIDFTGGSLLEIEFSKSRPANSEISDALKDQGLANLYIQPVGDKGIIIRTEALNEDQHQQILKKIQEAFVPTIDINQVENQAAANEQPDNSTSTPLELVLDENQLSSNEVIEVRFDSIGPIIGNELKSKAITAIILVLIAIIIYLAYAFRKVSRPAPSWQYGLAAVVALAHDVLIVIGIFSALGHFFNIQVDALFVTALLTLLGFSVHDTIVTFDRIRENIFRQQDKTFEEVINISINETITRSINTSMTTLIVLTSIFLFGGESVKYFSLALIFGIIVGTYSSIFIASPMLLIWYRWKYKKTV